MADPDEREVDVYEPNAPLRTSRVRDTFEVPEILPGFSLPVVRLFGAKIHHGEYRDRGKSLCGLCG